VGGHSTPTRTHIPALLLDILVSRIERGRLFDQVVHLDQVPDDYPEMSDWEAIKVLIEF
jgi:threonine dehydrogenase-like Zn-dependent dehydrogenase